MEHTLMDLNINAEEHFKQIESKRQSVSTNGTTTNVLLNGEHSPNNTNDHHATTNGHTNDDANSDKVLFITSDVYDYSQFGFTLDEVYRLARLFVKEKEGLTLQLSYQDRNLLHVLAKQAYFGAYKEDAQKNIGFLDLVGKDRMQLWKSLSTISKDEAMKEFITLLVKVCPAFHSSLEERKRKLDEEKRKRHLEEEQQIKMSQQREHKLTEEELKSQEENKKKREDVQKKQIQEALNQQTYPHFKAYAEQQHPSNQLAQQELIKQLQEQHFEQYMNQVYQQQLLHQQQQAEQLKALRVAQKSQKKQQEQSTTTVTNESANNETSFTSQFEAQSTNFEQLNLNDTEVTKPTEQVALDDDVNSNEDGELPPISAATMFTRRDIKEFKELVRKDNDAIIKIGSGETVTVRVPTHEDGRLLFWEFATDYYDVGFGLYFEWTISPSSNVTVHVSDSSEDEGEGEEGADTRSGDIEKGKASSNKPPCDEIIPIFRRDSHMEVYAGSHLYPGRGVYLLKFDNSYSLWRSKTLYYRVYYSK